MLGCSAAGTKTWQTYILRPLRRFHANLSVKLQLRIVEWREIDKLIRTTGQINILHHVLLLVLTVTTVVTFAEVHYSSLLSKIEA